MGCSAVTIASVAGTPASVGNSSEEATTYSWDYENRLAAVELPSGAISTFTYKGDGLRVQKASSKESVGKFRLG